MAITLTTTDGNTISVSVSGGSSTTVSTSSTTVSLTPPATRSIEVRAQGPKGDTGETGPQGPIGPQGPAGQDGAGGLVDVVDDATPQLGGNLDTNNNNINFGDTDEAVFGAGSDLRIYHAGGAINHIFGAVGASTYITGGTDLYLRGVNGEEAVTINGNGAVELFHDNVKKFETTSTGVDVTGNMQVSGSFTSVTDQDIVFTPSGTGSVNLDGTVKFKRFTSAPDAFEGGMYADNNDNLYFGVS